MTQRRITSKAVAMTIAEIQGNTRFDVNSVTK